MILVLLCLKAKKIPVPPKWIWHIISKYEFMNFPADYSFNRFNFVKRAIKTGNILLIKKIYCHSDYYMRYALIKGYHELYHYIKCDFSTVFNAFYPHKKFKKFADTIFFFSEKTVQFLIDSGCTYTLLQYPAFKTKNVELIKKCCLQLETVNLSAVYDLGYRNIIAEITHIKNFDKYLDTAFYCAYISDNLEKFKYFLNFNKIDLNIYYYLAIHFNSAKITNYLSKICSVDAGLYYSCYYNNFKCIKKFIKLGAKKVSPKIDLFIEIKIYLFFKRVKF